MNYLSSYILTHNSEKYLALILDQLMLVSDDIFVVDSGSTDQTKHIVEKYDKVTLYSKPLENFKEQRWFAEKSCAHDWVLFLDSDEIPDAQFIESIIEFKNTTPLHDAYVVPRVWNVLGQWVHSIYPISSPDYPIRLYNKKTTSFENSRLVHEAPVGYTSLGKINGRIEHYTFETKSELRRKLQNYSSIAAQDLLNGEKKINALKVILNPIAAFIKYFVFKKGFKDGRIGWILGVYAYRYTRNKYLKAKQ